MIQLRRYDVRKLLLLIFAFILSTWSFSQSQALFWTYLDRRDWPAAIAEAEKCFKQDPNADLNKKIRLYYVIAMVIQNKEEGLSVHATNDLLKQQVGQVLYRETFLTRDKAQTGKTYISPDNRTGYYGGDLDKSKLSKEQSIHMNFSCIFRQPVDFRRFVNLPCDIIGVIKEVSIAMSNQFITLDLKLADADIRVDPYY